MTETYITSENVSVLQAALLLMIWISPFTNSVSRYYCTLLNSDGNVNISDLASEGLDMNKAAALQRGKFGRAEEDVGGLPSLDSMLETIYKQNQIYLKFQEGYLISFCQQNRLSQWLPFWQCCPRRVLAWTSIS